MLFLCFIICKLSDGAVATFVFIFFGCTEHIILPVQWCCLYVWWGCWVLSTSAWIFLFTLSWTVFHSYCKQSAQKIFLWQMLEKQNPSQPTNIAFVAVVAQQAFVWVRDIMGELMWLKVPTGSSFNQMTQNWKGPTNSCMTMTNVQLLVIVLPLVFALGFHSRQILQLAALETV